MEDPLVSLTEKECAYELALCNLLRHPISDVRCATAREMIHIIPIEPDIGKLALASMVSMLKEGSSYIDNDVVPEYHVQQGILEALIVIGTFCLDFAKFTIMELELVLKSKPWAKSIAIEVIGALSIAIEANDK